jgi:glutamine---fructose-6-phosphate transaminase (isomerizing)
MSSVVGYIGKNYSWDFVIDALSRLEYRGYDAAGFACLDPSLHKVLFVKAVGPLQNLIDKVSDNIIDGRVGVGHTRWATHGSSTEANAHPHFDENKRLALVHNGIIENHHVLRAQLKREGHEFVSQTDTEVLAHCLEFALGAIEPDKMKNLVVSLVERLQGAYAFIALLQGRPDFLLAVRKGSSLCIGIGDGEFFVASDPIAFAGRTDKMIYMPNESFALITDKEIFLYSFEGERLTFEVESVEAAWEESHHSFESDLLKEIYEQKQAIHATAAFYKALFKKESVWLSLDCDRNQIKKLKHITLFASGSSWHAAHIGKFFIEMIAKIPVDVALASELRYMPFFSHEDSLYLALSQSGETADTLEALRMMNGLGLQTAVMTNVAGSTMVREAQGFLMLKAGPERSVCATKGFTSEVGMLYLLAHFIAYEKGLVTHAQVDGAYRNLFIAAQALESSIERYKRDLMVTCAPRYAKYEKFLFIGRHMMYPFALEAALKLKEVSYLFAHCSPAGELKHGTLAMIDENTPVFVFSHLDPLIYKKLVSNAQEIKARGGHLISFGFKGQDELKDMSDCFFALPQVDPLLGPLVMSGVMQLFVYYIAQELGRPVDRPRNVAKTITVE